LLVIRPELATTAVTNIMGESDHATLNPHNVVYTTLNEIE